MARLGAPHGVCGLLRLHLFSRQPQFFVNCANWWCQPAAAEGTESDWRLMAVERCLKHNNQWLVKLAAVDDRNAAMQWVNGLAAVDYEQLPAPDGDSFYWCNLLGLQVKNSAGALMGEVKELLDIGAHDVLSVRTEENKELLIPFVEKHIIAVDLEKKLITVDWQHDW